MTVTPQSQPNIEQIAERASRRRARMLTVSGIFFIVWQGVFFRWASTGAGLERTVDKVLFGSWLIWAVALCVVLATGGGLMQRREVRAMMQDELSTANRRAGIAFGFWAMALATLVLYPVTMFEPVATPLALHIILSFGLGAAVLRFAMLERRAERVR